jgi:hypothetical protein
MSITSVECFQVRWAGQTDYGGVSAWVRITDDRGEVGCVSAWNRDPAGGVIGVQKGPL